MHTSPAPELDPRSQGTGLLLHTPPEASPKVPERWEVLEPVILDIKERLDQGVTSLLGLPDALPRPYGPNPWDSNPLLTSPLSPPGQFSELGEMSHCPGALSVD